MWAGTARDAANRLDPVKKLAPLARTRPPSCGGGDAQALQGLPLPARTPLRVASSDV